MVGGIEKFREAFAKFSDNFVIIGGAACDEVLSGTSMRPRATLDIDLIVIAENMTPEFAKAFWQFIADGEYQRGIRKNEDKTLRYVLYSFDNGKPGFPVKIELLSRHNDIFTSVAHTEPLPIDGEVSSLSAIILDEPYYNLTIENSTIKNGLRYASPIALAALKAKAYLNLVAERATGHHVNTKDITKHRNDVLKLSAIIRPSDTVEVDSEVVATINEFTQTLVNALPSQSMQDALGTSEEIIRGYLELLQTYYVAKR